MYIYFRPRNVCHVVELPVAASSRNQLASVINSMSANLGDTFGKQLLVASQLNQGFTVIRDANGGTDFAIGIIEVGKRPQHAVDVHGGDRVTWGERSGPGAPERARLSRTDRGDQSSGRAIWLTASLTGAPTLGVLLLRKDVGDASLQLYYDYPQIGPLAGAPLAQMMLPSGSQQAPHAFPVDPGQYYLVLSSNTSNAAPGAAVLNPLRRRLRHGELRRPARRCSVSDRAELRNENDDAIAAVPVESPETSLAGPPPPPRILRSIYWFAWFIIVPFAMACAFVWGLSPSSGMDRPGVIGWLESVVREQPVPVGIVAFTLFEMALWAARQWLPLARFANPPMRADLPARHAPPPSSRLRVLLDEAESIFERNAKAVERDLSPHERGKLKEERTALRFAMAKTSRSTRRRSSRPSSAPTARSTCASAGGRKSEIREYAESILVAIAVAMALRAFVVEAFKIPSGSMIPTLQVGDHIFVNKFVYGPAIPLTDKRVWTSMPPKRGAT